MLFFSVVVESDLIVGFWYIVWVIVNVVLDV